MSLVLQEENTKDDKINTLERLIKDKDVEIESLKNRLREVNIFQLDGDFTIDDESESTNDSTDQESVGDTSHVEVQSNSQEGFKCDYCDFSTENRKGLKIHIGRIHKLKCGDCDLNFQDEECLHRHMSAKTLLSNIDPQISPDETMRIEILRNDETCLVILDQTLNNNLLQLHCWSCWSREVRYCPDLPPESVLNDAHYNGRHTDIGSIVLGDLTMAGCYVDWDQATRIIEAGQN